MKNFTLFLFIVALTLTACQRIDKHPVSKGELNKVVLKNLNGIPAEYGNLLSVTTHAQYSGYSQLWFVDDTNTIRMVLVDFQLNRINENVLVIPRN